MTQEKESFLGRWSRLKQEDRKAPEKAEGEKAGEAPTLPPVDKLTPESDFRDFMHPKVEDALRRVALKKLFSDPHFNVPDPYEAYSGDWTGGEVIPDEMMKTLNQARTHLFGDEKKQAEEKAQEEEQVQKDNPQTADAPQEDEPRRQDT